MIGWGPKSRSVILVTGAPRSGTTPVGVTLSHAPGACLIYEPWGVVTGDRRFRTAFPIPGTDGFNHEDIARFLEDLGGLRLCLKSQRRPSHASEPFYRQWLLKVTGSRALHSLRLARLNPFCRQIIWKDPFAVLAVPDILQCGIPVVVTVRPPLAHAASYKRLGWRAQLKTIYPRFAERYGGDPLIDDLLTRPTLGAVETAAAFWRMASGVIATVVDAPGLHIINSSDLEEDETAVYERLFRKLGLRFDRARAYLLKRLEKARAQNRDGKVVHDWSRSVGYTNSYWQTVLSAEEVSRVEALTGDVELAMKASGGATREADFGG